MKLNVFIRKSHKWLGLILAIQFIIWVSSGLMMSIIPLDLLNGVDNIAQIQPVSFSSNKLIPVDKLSLGNEQTITSINISNGNRGLMYTLTDDKGAIHLFNANTGEKFSSMDEKTAINIAKTNYSGTETFIKSELIKINDSGYWKITFDDWESTAILLDTTSGNIVARDNNYRRAFLYLLYFHIMDYQDGKFRNWLLRFFASIATLFVISGIYLLFKSKYKNDLGLLSKIKQ